MNFKVFGITKA
jgi:hypothetical protein